MEIKLDDKMKKSLTVMPIGMVGVGKSCLLNSLIQKDVFTVGSIDYIDGCTYDITIEQGDYKGTNIIAIDCPGFMDLRKKPSELIIEAYDKLKNVHIDLVVLVIRADCHRITSFEFGIVQIISEILTSRFTDSNNFVLVFTHMDLLSEEEKKKFEKKANTIESVINTKLESDLKIYRHFYFSNSSSEFLDEFVNYGLEIKKTGNFLMFTEPNMIKKLKLMRIFNKIFGEESEDKKISHDEARTFLAKSEKGKRIKIHFKREDFKIITVTSDNLNIISQTINFIIIGDSSVGKSSIFLQFVTSKFSDNPGQTIGVDYQTKFINYDDKYIRIKVWDTAGQERYRSLTQNFYRNCDAILLVYDITNYDSFDNIKNWIRDVRCMANKHVIITLIGNKSDRNIDRVITYDEGMLFAEDNNVNFFEVSAKNLSEVEDIFFLMTKDFIETLEDKNILKVEKKKINLYSKPSTNGQCCKI